MIQAINLGPDPASDVVISDVIPAAVTFVSASPSPGGACTLAATLPAQLRCIWSDLTAVGPAGVRSVRVVVTVPAGTPGGTSILNTATVASVSIDPAPENNSASDLTTVYVGGPSADIEVQRSWSSAQNRAVGWPSRWASRSRSG